MYIRNQWEADNVTINLIASWCILETKAPNNKKKKAKFEWKITPKNEQEQ